MSNTDALAAIAAAYQQNVAAPAAAPSVVQPAPAAPPPQVPQGFYLASDGRMYPLPTQASAAPPPAPAPAPAPAAAPAPVAPTAPTGFQIPPQQAVALATQHAQQTLPINPPEAQQALLPEAQSQMPEPKRKRNARKPSAAAAIANATETDDGADLISLASALASLLPKGHSYTVVGSGEG